MKLREVIFLNSTVITLAVAAAIALLMHFVLDRSYPEVNAAGLLYLSIVVLSLVHCGLNLMFARYKIIRPIQQIRQLTEAFRKDHTLRSRLVINGSAEIVQLGNQINEMLDEIQRSHQNLVAARERLKFEATHDPLTGTWNCAAALELLDREIGLSQRQGNTVAVLMVDLDHFKSINDQFGHVAGDQVLKIITVSIAGVLRNTDVLARYGGEEFLIIAPNCDSEEALLLADRLLLRVQTTPVQVGEARARVTASIGIAVGSFPLTSEELIALADRALYRAKANGRNRCEIDDGECTPAKRSLYSMPRRKV